MSCSLDLNTGSEPLPVIDQCSEFQTDGTENRKAPLVNSFVVKGLTGSRTSDKSKVHADSSSFMCTLK